MAVCDAGTCHCCQTVVRLTAVVGAGPCCVFSACAGMFWHLVSLGGRAEVAGADLPCTVGGQGVAVRQCGATVFGCTFCALAGPLFWRAQIFCWGVCSNLTPPSSMFRVVHGKPDFQSQNARSRPRLQRCCSPGSILMTNSISCTACLRCPGRPDSRHAVTSAHPIQPEAQQLRSRAQFECFEV